MCENKDWTDCVDYLLISLVAHANKTVVKLVTNRHRNFYEWEQMFSQEVYGL